LNEAGQSFLLLIKSLKDFDGRIFLKTLATISTGGRKEWLWSILGSRAKKHWAHGHKKSSEERWELNIIF